MCIYIYISPEGKGAATWDVIATGLCTSCFLKELLPNITSSTLFIKCSDQWSWAFIEAPSWLTHRTVHENVAEEKRNRPPAITNRSSFLLHAVLDLLLCQLSVGHSSNTGFYPGFMMDPQMYADVSGNELHRLIHTFTLADGWAAVQGADLPSRSKAAFPVLLKDTWTGGS